LRKFKRPPEIELNTVTERKMELLASSAGLSQTRIFLRPETCDLSYQLEYAVPSLAV
jgi:CO dehydrogenase/acetyl-CoA synthase delta subunit